MPGNRPFMAAGQKFRYHIIYAENILNGCYSHFLLQRLLMSLSSSYRQAEKLTNESHMVHSGVSPCFYLHACLGVGCKGLHEWDRIINISFKRRKKINLQSWALAFFNRERMPPENDRSQECQRGKAKKLENYLQKEMRLSLLSVDRWVW